MEDHNCQDYGKYLPGKHEFPECEFCNIAGRIFYAVNKNKSPISYYSSADLPSGIIPLEESIVNDLRELLKTGKTHDIELFRDWAVPAPGAGNYFWRLTTKRSGYPDIYSISPNLASSIKGVRKKLLAQAVA
jgi:hypothetical protein